jgi:hypothetical protein
MIVASSVTNHYYLFTFLSLLVLLLRLDFVLLLLPRPSFLLVDVAVGA